MWNKGDGRMVNCLEEQCKLTHDVEGKIATERMGEKLDVNRTWLGIKKTLHYRMREKDAR